jgi:hypothetical protein
MDDDDLGLGLSDEDDVGPAGRGSVSASVATATAAAPRGGAAIVSAYKDKAARRQVCLCVRAVCVVSLCLPLRLGVA